MVCIDKELFGLQPRLCLPSYVTGLRRKLYISNNKEPIPEKYYYVKYGDSLEKSINIWFSTGFYLDSDIYRREVMSLDELQDVVSLISINTNILSKFYENRLEFSDFKKSLKFNYITLGEGVLEMLPNTGKKGIWIDIKQNFYNIKVYSL